MGGASVLRETLALFNMSIHECSSTCMTENKEKQNRSTFFENLFQTGCVEYVEDRVLLEPLGSFLLKMLQW